METIIFAIILVLPFFLIVLITFFYKIKNIFDISMVVMIFIITITIVIAWFHSNNNKLNYYEKKYTLDVEGYKVIMYDDKAFVIDSIKTEYYIRELDVWVNIEDFD